MDEEIWLPVASKEGLMASSHGRVMLPQSVIVMPNGGLKLIKPRPSFGFKTKASKGASHSSLNVQSRKFGNVKVHRAVCEAFHGPPPSKKSVVIHIDENSLNNLPENLRWGTQKENLNMPKFIAYCKSRTGENNPYVKGRKRREKAS